MLVQRSFLSILVGNSLRAACNILSCSSVQAEAGAAGPPAAGLSADDADTAGFLASAAGVLPPLLPPLVGFPGFWAASLLYCSMHSSFARGVSGLQMLFTNNAMVSQRLAPPAGYFFIAFAKAATSSFDQGVMALAALAFSAFSAAILRASSRRFFASMVSCAFSSCASSTFCLICSKASTLGLSKASAPPNASVNSTICRTDNSVHNNSTSSFIASISDQIFSPPLSAPLVYAERVSLRKSCRALRNCFFSLSR
mmetsp:Transcript_25402/g.35619  ORF Transcript_25402/g.35619 Transcript_25402/m.35619 type:complete len:255 (-) Transcript_25402:567-1331(-)